MVESTTPALSHSSMILSQRRSVISSGFSTITCLPARAAATAGSNVHAAGRADGDHVDRRIGQHVVQVVIGLAAGGLGQPVRRRRARS